MGRKKTAKKQDNVRETQMEIVKAHLNKYGKITRNQALSMGITRLGAIIDYLKKKGYIIEGYWKDKEKTDYCYEIKEVIDMKGKNNISVEIVDFDFKNLNELEMLVAKTAEEIKKDGEEVVLINIFEPILNILSNMYTMPVRSIILLSSEKHAHIGKVTFNIMDVYKTIKDMFYKNGKKNYLKNRVKRMLQKYKVKYSDSPERKVIFVIYGFNNASEEDMIIKKELVKELIL